MKKILFLAVAILLTMSSFAETIPANDSRVTYVGRTWVDGTDVSFDWTATYFRVVFSGKSLTMTASETKWDTDAEKAATRHNYYNVWIDSSTSTEPHRIIEVAGNDTTIELIDPAYLKSSKQKVHTVIVLDVDNNKTYFINETVPIKVTVLPNAEGNITLYINGEPHVLTLQTVDNITFVEFNATELKDGVNYVFATYEGTDMYGPSWAEDSFNATKYNATVIIKTDNITRGDTEVINITVPEDATGILNVTVNGTPYYIEIINGNHFTARLLVTAGEDLCQILQNNFHSFSLPLLM